MGKRLPQTDVRRSLLSVSRQYQPGLIGFIACGTVRSDGVGNVELVNDFGIGSIYVSLNEDYVDVFFGREQASDLYQFLASVENADGNDSMAFPLIPVGRRMADRFRIQWRTENGQYVYFGGEHEVQFPVSCTFLITKPL